MPREHRATRQQVKERIELAELFLESRLSPSEIKKEFRERFGLMWRQTQRFVTRARRNVIARNRVDVQVERVNSYLFYNATVRDEGMPIKARLFAQTQIDKLLGLRAPERHQVTAGRPPDDDDPRVPDYSEVLDRLFGPRQTAPTVEPASNGQAH